jgi:hypothetical protein
VREKRVKGAFQVSALGEADNVGTQAQVKAEISEFVVFLGGILGGRVGQGARYARSEKRRTFGVIFLGCFGRGSCMCQQIRVRKGVAYSPSSAVSISVLSGFACWMVASSLAWMRSARAFSTGPNTRARSLVWLTLMLLARALFAIVLSRVKVLWCGGVVVLGRVKLLSTKSGGEKFGADF